MDITEIDILGIHTKIQHYFDDEIQRIPMYVKRLNDLKDTLNSGNLQYHSKIEIEKNII